MSNLRACSPLPRLLGGPRAYVETRGQRGAPRFILLPLCLRDVEDEHAVLEGLGIETDIGSPYILDTILREESPEIEDKLVECKPDLVFGLGNAIDFLLEFDALALPFFRGFG